MNRMLGLGVVLLLALVGVALLGESSQVVAGHGCHHRRYCNGWGDCYGNYCHGGGRCHGGYGYSSCNGASGCNGGWGNGGTAMIYEEDGGYAAGYGQRGYRGGMQSAPTEQPAPPALQTAPQTAPQAAPYESAPQPQSQPAAPGNFQAPPAPGVQAPQGGEPSAVAPTVRGFRRVSFVR